MPIAHPHLQITYALPYGAILRPGGVQFVVFSRTATSMRVLLYDKVQDREPADVVQFDREVDRWGDIWSVFVPGVGAGQLYHYQADGPFDPGQGHRFDGNARLIDPYAQALAGHFQPADDGIVRPPKCVVVEDRFDWQHDRHLKRPLSESVIYEMHVRGFTRSETSDVEHPGTYLGVIEKIPYLQSLGVTAVELMPVHEFPILDCLGNAPRVPNYWGYDPLAFFSPHRGYTASAELGAQVTEFRHMVRALHEAGIEVILDVVFNHTAEGNELGPTVSFKGLENRVYYMLDGDNGYRNYSGCGNTVNGNHPVVREMIFHCLRHWVHAYHVDGFRFDLASILSRGRDGELRPNPPIVEMIAEDPLLADTKIIAEAWDAAGAYQVGSFSDQRWAEWNGKFRDDVRRFWRGDAFTLGSLATRLAGSSDLYGTSGRHPYHSINFVVSHDGFTLNDLVSYSHKHNEANGEGNRDGDNNNESCHYGEEGPTDDPRINKLRLRQIKNMLTTLLVSQGVPMLSAGDECRRTQQGNNNAYCQDNPISWFDWSLLKANAGLLRFCRSLISFRRDQPTVRRTTFLNGPTADHRSLPDVAWFSASGDEVDWNGNEHSLVCLFSAPQHEPEYSPDARHLLMFIHAATAPRRFEFPQPAKTVKWRKFIDTAADSPRDIFPDFDGPARRTDRGIQLKERSIVCFVSPRLAKLGSAGK